MKEIGNVKTMYISGNFEYTQNGATVGTRKFYAFGSKRMAMQSNKEPVKVLFSDHLNSTPLILGSRTAVLDQLLTMQLGSMLDQSPFRG
jgi:hypothetical protein